MIIPRLLAGLFLASMSVIAPASASALDAGFPAATESRVDLAGAWFFALDPTDNGEARGWRGPVESWTGAEPHPQFRWDVAQVPHDYLTDPRYRYTGTAWYRRSFELPADAPAGLSWRLRFDTVFQRCTVWINGVEVGSHEGGYTPFELDVTAALRPGRLNLLTVRVNNGVRFLALPGSRTPRAGYEHSPIGEQFPWMNYGGILGAVALHGRPAVWVERQTIRAEVAADLGSATLRALATLRNDTDRPCAASVSLSYGDDLPAVASDVEVPARSTVTVALPPVDVRGENLRLWDLDAPHRRIARATVSSAAGVHVREDSFGIRRLEVRDARFLLNGREVRLAGGNRARGHPTLGGRDTDELVAQDLGLMKAAGLRFARLQHTAPGRNVLEWADREGMLLFLEVGMWGHAAADLPQAALRDQFKAEMRELVQLAENHPCVVGWSLGNEYESWTQEGIDWTRDMAAFVKELDPTRPVTFAGLSRVMSTQPTDPAGPHALDFVDIIAVNIYAPARSFAGPLDRTHARWPDKPIWITEYGMRADEVEEPARIEHFDGVFATVRERPWICGFSYWSFNDYESRYPGSGKDGYRRWGLVDEHRVPRALYHHVAEQLRAHGWGSPAVRR